MNKKVLGIVLTLLFVAMLATPIIGTVMAGKGQEKLDFELVIVGGPTVDPFIMDRFKEADGIMHFFGWVWVVTGDYYIIVDGDTYYPTSYYATLDLHMNIKTGGQTLQVRETITLDGGTLEIVTNDRMTEFGYVGNFVGHGTGSLEGVKVQGTSSSVDGVEVHRDGTVMGWPT